MFPILGGRLLKEKFIRMHLEPNVSNPWREAIEALAGYCFTVSKKFPILGGRLLKEIF